jgi:hypothetical protein
MESLIVLQQIKMSVISNLISAKNHLSVEIKIAVHQEVFETVLHFYQDDVQKTVPQLFDTTELHFMFS